MKDLMHTLFTLVRRVWQPALMMSVTLVAFTRCVEWKQPTDADVPGVSRYVAGVQTVAGDANAVLRSGAVPSAGSGPVLSAPIPSLILLGGTVQVTASAATPFSTILVAVPGVTDYWELTLPVATTQVQVLVVFSQEIPKTTFELDLAGGLGRARGALQASPVSVIAVGTGDIQVNITWDSPADIDLQVVDPSNATIYWAAKTSATGGQLDLDSNAGCATDGPRAENVFWASGLVAPHGEYLVRVDHWSSCGAPLTHYVVTVNSKGEPPRVFQGVFTGTGDAGGKGSGKNIATVSY